MSKQILVMVTRATGITNRIWVYATPDADISSKLSEVMDVISHASVWGGIDKREFSESLCTTQVSIEVALETTLGITHTLVAALRRRLPRVSFAFYADAPEMQASGSTLASATRTLTQVTGREELLGLLDLLQAQKVADDEAYANQG